MRVRFRFAKTGKVRWTSHRDVARMWERAFRRVQLPLAYTEGFSPRPKVAFGLALPTGYESVAEYLDIDLDPSAVLSWETGLEEPRSSRQNGVGMDADVGGAGFDVAALPARLTPALPVGVDVLAAAQVDRSGDSLQHQVLSCEWDITVTGASVDELREHAARVLEADSITITRERKGKQVTDDIRPALVSLEVGEASDDGVQLVAELASQTRALRPSELLGAMSPALGERRVRRTHQWIERDGAKRDILPLPATDAPPAMERAS